MRHAALALSLLLAATPAFAADAPAPERKMLLTEPVAGAPDKQVVMVDVTWAPGSALGMHTHPGDEYSTVVAGELKIHAESGEWRTVKTGDSFHNNPGVVHEARNDGTVPARTIQTYVVAKDQPVTAMQKK